MKELLTRAEMETRFQGEWVLVEDPESDELLEVQKGWVVHHSRDREEIGERAIALHSRHCAILYFGSWPRDKEFIL